MAELSLQPLSKTQPHRWDYACAAHLLNRAGFGGTLAEINHLVDIGPEKSVQMLLDYAAIPDDLPPMKFGELTAPVEGREIRNRGNLFKNATEEQRKSLLRLNQAAQRQKSEELKLWWLDRMIRTRRPLEEKMTLFWHGLFVSSLVAVKSAVRMYRQNELLREHAVGNAKTLTLEISKDVAMLEYLNNDQNKKAHPNENYARELMELFTLGIGNYTEQDIKESARAFSGWTHLGDKFIFNPNDHDNGLKTFLGHTGNLDGTDIVNIIFEQPATPKYFATRLLKFFAIDEPSPEIIAQLASVLHANKFQISAALAALFSSEWFYGKDVMRTQIKSPVQLVVGALRFLNVNVTEPATVNSSLKMMGQELFYAPTVKGWDGGRSWINTSTLFSRYNLPAYLVTGRLPTALKKANDDVTVRAQFSDFDSGWNGLLDLAEGNASSTDSVVDLYLKKLIHDKVDPRKREELIGFLNGTGDANSHTFDPVAADAEGRLRSLVHLIMSMPDFQIC